MVKKGRPSAADKKRKARKRTILNVTYFVLSLTTACIFYVVGGPTYETGLFTVGAAVAFDGLISLLRK